MLGYTEAELRKKAVDHIEFAIDWTAKQSSDFGIEYNYACTRGQVQQSSMLGLITIPEENAYYIRLEALKKELKKKLTA